jgi:hypothetical protein
MISRYDSSPASLRALRTDSPLRALQQFLSS